MTLGGYEVQSALGQSLRMSIQINARPDEEIDASCFRVNPFSTSGDGLPQLTTAQLRLDRRPNDIRLVITSSRAIMDPIVRVAIDVGCNTTLRRELTLLLDPPSSVETLPQVADARPTPIPIPSAGSGSMTNTGGGRGGSASGSPAAGAPTSADPGTSQGAAGAGAGAAAASRAATSSASPRPSARAPARAFATPPSEPLAQVAPRPPRSLEPPSSRTPSSVPPPPPARPPASRDRLTISASPLPLESTGSTLSPRLNLATSLGDRSRPPLPESTMSSLRQKQARLRAAPAGEDLPSLEAEVVVLQKRTTDMQRQLDEVMSQMASLRGSAGGRANVSPATSANAPGPTIATANPPATTTTTTTTAPIVTRPPGEVERPDKPWAAIWTDPRMVIAGPVAVMLLLLILGFVFWLRRERDLQRRSDRWSYIPVVEGAPVTDRADPQIPEPTRAPLRERASPKTVSPTMTPVTGSKTDTLPTGEFTPPQPQSYQFKSYASGQAAQDLGVSDLAQATEKASVFVTLGRPAQAIDVLRDHIDHEPKSSAMAWLMLLDLYRQTNRHDDFDEVAERFHSEYNAVTPEWNQAVAPLHDNGLGAFPYLIARIRDEWPTAAAKGFIEGLLYDNRGGSRIGFSIPAFRDLLLLHSMVDEYLRGSENEGNLDSTTGRVVGPSEIPTPPDHLASIWMTASPERPVYTTPLPALSPGSPAAPAPPQEVVVPDTNQLSALEKSYPIIAQAIGSRWGQPGLAAYLSNLIRSSTDQGAGLTNEALSELVLLHDVALDLGDPEPMLPLA